MQSNFAKVFAMPFLYASIRSFSFLMCDMRTLFFLDLLFAMCFIPLEFFQDLMYCFVSLGPFVVTDALCDHFADIVQLFFLSFLSVFPCSSMVAFLSSYFCPLFAIVLHRLLVDLCLL